MVLDPFGLRADVVEPIEKFNPYHGEHGRFASRGEGVGRVLAQGIANGGFTWHPSTGHTPHSGFAVATRGNNVEIPLTDIHSNAQREHLVNEMSKYMDAMKPKLRANPALHIGGWHDEAHHEFVLDLSEVVHDKATAVRLGRERNQQAIFDLGSLSEVATGGTGDRVGKQASDGATLGRRAGLRRSGGDEGLDPHLPGRGRGPGDAPLVLLDPFELIEKFNPHHDDHGRFSSGDGGGGGDAKTGGGKPSRLIAQNMGGVHARLRDQQSQSPSKGQWANQQEILGAGVGDPSERQHLLDGVDHWTGSGFKYMKGTGERVLQGKTSEADHEGRQADQVKAMIQTAEDGPPIEIPLYRSRSISQTSMARMSDYNKYTTVGNEFDYPLVSFSSSRTLANGFGSGSHEQLNLVIKNGAHAIPANGISSNQGEGEYIVSGRMKVASHKIETRDSGTVLHTVTLEPLGPAGRGTSFKTGEVALSAAKRKEQTGKILESYDGMKMSKFDQEFEGLKASDMKAHGWTYQTAANGDKNWVQGKGLLPNGGLGTDGWTKK